MRWLVAALRELVALFVDDGGVALLTLAWLAAAGLLLPWLLPRAGLHGPLLFLGLAAILVASALRRARRAAPRRPPPQ